MPPLRPVSRACRRTAILVVAALCLATLSNVTAAETIPLSATRVPLNIDDPAERTVGRLSYRGGLAIRSTDLRFGGLSGLLVEDQGRRVVAVSDKGHWFTAELRYDADRTLSGIGEGRLFPIRDLAGMPVRGKRFSDAEALERVRGRLVVAFEHRHRLWFYGGLPTGKQAGPLAELLLPRRFAKSKTVRSNHGIEAITALRDGRLLALAEGPKDDDPLGPGWIVEGKRWRPVAYRRAGGFRPTGATTLPSGDVLVLERRFSWIGGMSARIVRVPAKEIRPGATIAGTEIGRLQAPLTVDNFEGISVRRDQRGRLMVYLISDDNFHILQRTLLLMFELTGDG